MERGGDWVESEPPSLALVGPHGTLPRIPALTSGHGTTWFAKFTPIFETTGGGLWLEGRPVWLEGRPVWLAWLGRCGLGQVGGHSHTCTLPK